MLTASDQIQLHHLTRTIIFNDAIGRATLAQKVDAKLKELGYPYTYQIICDARNNPPSVIDNNEIRCKICFAVGNEVVSYEIGDLGIIRNARF